MAELADAQDLGSCTYGVWVRPPLPAPIYYGLWPRKKAPVDRPGLSFCVGARFFENICAASFYRRLPYRPRRKHPFLPQGPLHKSRDTFGRGAFQAAAFKNNLAFYKPSLRLFLLAVLLAQKVFFAGLPNGVCKICSIRQNGLARKE